VQGLGDEFLSGSVFAVDKNGCLGIANPFHKVVEVLHGRGFSNHVGKTKPCTEFLGQFVYLGHGIGNTLLHLRHFVDHKRDELGKIVDVLGGKNGKFIKLLKQHFMVRREKTLHVVADSCVLFCFVFAYDEAVAKDAAQVLAVNLNGNRNGGKTGLAPEHPRTFCVHAVYGRLPGLLDAVGKPLLVCSDGLADGVQRIEELALGHTSQKALGVGEVDLHLPPFANNLAKAPYNMKLVKLAPAHVFSHFQNSCPWVFMDAGECLSPWSDIKILIGAGDQKFNTF